MQLNFSMMTLIFETCIFSLWVAKREIYITCQDMNNGLKGDKFCLSKISSTLLILSAAATGTHI